jgi:hypothetical protein
MVKNQETKLMLEKINKFMEFDLNELENFEFTYNIKDDEIKITELLQKLDDDYFTSEMYNLIYFQDGYFNDKEKLKQKSKNILITKLNKINKYICKFQDIFEENLFNIQKIDKEVHIELKYKRCMNEFTKNLKYNQFKYYIYV